MVLGLLTRHEVWLTNHGFNPCVAVRELRSKQRPVWERWLSIAGAVAIGGVPAPMLMLTTHDLFTGHFRPSDARTVFDIVNIVAAWVLTVLIAVPAAIGIVSEREKQTLEPLRATALQPGDVIGGKIIGAMAARLPILGLVIAMQLWVVVLGGVGVFQWLGALLLLIGVALWAACVGTAVSAAFANTVSAIVVTFVVIGALGTAAVLLPVIRMEAVPYRWEGANGLAAGLGLLVLSPLVTYRAIAGAGRSMASRLHHLAGAMALCVASAVAVSAAILVAHPHQPGWVLHAFLPPLGVAVCSPTLGGSRYGAEAVHSIAPGFWIVCFLLSLLGSAFFHSMGAIVYERRTR